MTYQIRVASSDSIQPKLVVTSDTFDGILKALKDYEESPKKFTVVGYYIQKVEESTNTETTDSKL